MGARNVEPVNGGGDWTCSHPGHWIFAGTGMKKGDAIPGLVGWEYHGQPATEIPGLEIVAEGTAWVGGVRPHLHLLHLLHVCTPASEYTFTGPLGSSD